MPGRLKAVLAVLSFQVLANGYIGFVLVDAVAEEESHGARVPNAGLYYFVGYLSIAIALLLLACVLLTGTRKRWIRITVICVEVVGVISGAITLFSGQVTAALGIALAITVIVTLNHEDVVEYYGR